MSDTAQSLNVFLLDAKLSDPADALIKSSSAGDTVQYDTYPVALNGTPATLWVRKTKPEFPEWARFLGVDSALPAKYKNHSLAAVLTFQLADVRFVAIAFGQGGRFLLKRGCYQREFGLRAAMNSLDPAQLRSLDARSLDSAPMHTRRQATRHSPLLAFEFDEWRDLVMKLSGPTTKVTKASTIGGRDSATVAAKLSRDDVPSVCQSLVTQHGKSGYKTDFPFYENLRPEASAQAEAAMQHLIADLHSGSTSGIGFFPPEDVAEENFLGFALKSTEPEAGDLVPEITADDVSARLAGTSLEKAEGRLDRLRLWAVYQGGITSSWPARECLYYEETSNGLLVLTEGLWWRVASDFVKQVRKEVADVSVVDLGLPPWPSKTREEDYNEQVFKQKQKASWALLDKKCVTPQGGTKIEPCDLLTDKRDFVHVKKYDSSSGPISHLFAQGTVSAELFVNSEDFRTQLADKLPAGLKDLSPAKAPDPRDYRIVYVIATKKKAKLENVLPFFSLVHLRTHLRRAARLGMPVAWQRIDLG